MPNPLEKPQKRLPKQHPQNGRRNTIIEGTIAPSTLNVLLKAGTIENELALENLRTRSKLNSSKVELIETDVKGKGDSEEVINDSWL